MPTYDPTSLGGRTPYLLLTSLVVPRPIAWVSTLSADGTPNLAPHSYFNLMSYDPMIAHFTSTGVKDSLRNCRETGEFVINVVHRDLLEEMNRTAADAPPEVSEFALAGLETVPSERISPPRVARAKAALECRVIDIISKGNGHMVFGEIVSVTVDDSVMVDGRVDAALLDPVARLGGSTYATLGDIVDLPRPSYADLTTEE